MSKIKIKKGDTVRVIAGKDKGKEGKVLVVDHKNERVIVEGVNVVKKHEKPSNANPDGGIINKELPISVSNVKLVDDKKKKTAKKSAKKNVKGAKK